MDYAGVPVGTQVRHCRAKTASRLRQLELLRCFLKGLFFRNESWYTYDHEAINDMHADGDGADGACRLPGSRYSYG